MFPDGAEEWFRSAVFKLGYCQHGGSGLGFQPSEVAEMGFLEILWYLAKLDEVREREADSLKSAGS